LKLDSLQFLINKNETKTKSIKESKNNFLFFSGLISMVNFNGNASLTVGGKNSLDSNIINKLNFSDISKVVIDCNKTKTSINTKDIFTDIKLINQNRDFEFEGCSAAECIKEKSKNINEMITDMQQDGLNKNEEIPTDDLIEIVSNSAKKQKSANSDGVVTNGILKDPSNKNKSDLKIDFYSSISVEDNSDAVTEDGIYGKSEKINELQKFVSQEELTNTLENDKINSLLHTKDLKSMHFQSKSSIDKIINPENLTGYSSNQIFANDYCFLNQDAELNKIDSVLFDSVELFKSKGINEIKVSLEPEYLGKLVIKIKTLNEKIDISIKVSTRYTNELLRENIQMLKDKLEGQDLNINQINIGIEEQVSKNEQSFADMQFEKKQGESAKNIIGASLIGNAAEPILDISKIGSENSYYLNALI